MLLLSLQGCNPRAHMSDKEKGKKEKKEKKEKTRKEKKRNETTRLDYAFWRQSNEEPSIILSCPGHNLHQHICGNNDATLVGV